MMIYIIDDDYRTALLESKILEAQKFKTELFVSSDQIENFINKYIQQLKANDVILLDCMIPESDYFKKLIIESGSKTLGEYIFKTIRNKSQKIKVFIITALQENNIIPNNQTTFVIAKPITKNTLDMIIEEII